jgi:HD-GYP domain-containing protein (c-di-GMP phosphodiesterase class II)/CheY-like chemotaxis protein
MKRIDYLKILLCTPNKTFSKGFGEYVKEDRNEYIFVEEGADCQIQFYKNKFDYCILDIETKNHSGLEVLRYIRLTHPSVKVFLMFGSALVFAEYEYTKKELSKMGVYESFVLPRPFEIILKNVTGTFSFKEGANTNPGGVSQEEECSENDNKFTHIKIDTFLSTQILLFDIFIRVNRNRYLKIFNQGDHVDVDRIKKYQYEKNMEYLYFKTQDRATYISFMNDAISRAANSPRNVKKIKINHMQNVTEKIFEDIIKDGISSNMLRESQSAFTSIRNVLYSNCNLAGLLDQLNTKDETYESHASLVSLFSIIICKELKWDSERSLNIIGMASLLHDIGKLKLPESILNKCPTEMTKSEYEKYIMHPEIGAEMLQDISLISEPVRQTIYQHHEINDGSGFPNNLMSKKIYPMAKIVSLADFYSHFLVRNHYTPFEALNIIFSDPEYVHMFDPEIVRAFITAFIKKERRVGAA